MNDKRDMVEILQENPLGNYVKDIRLLITQKL